MAEIIAPIKRHHERPMVRCGACKGTGVEHVWALPDALLVPTGNSCPRCDGSGAPATLSTDTSKDGGGAHG